MFGFKLLRCMKEFPTLTSYIGVNVSRGAGQYQRPQTPYVSKEHQQELRLNLFKERSALSPEEWSQAQQTLINKYKHINAHNVDAVILGMCNGAEQLPLAKNYIQNLQANGVSPNAASLGRLLRVYNATYHARINNNNELTFEEQIEVLEICKILRQKYDILDATSCENIIYGLITTTEWREALELLEMMKLSSTPTTQAYSQLTQKAFTMGDFKIGWKLLEEMVTNRKQPKCEIFAAYLNKISKEPQVQFLECLEKLLVFLGQNEIIITERVVKYIEDLAGQLPGVLTVSNTYIQRFGKCNNCGQHLQNVCISDAEFQALQDSFLQKVLIRQDVFQKSTPVEVERFKRFVEDTAPYDCVIDGLNVAYSTGAKKPPQVLANLLADVVKYFKRKNKYVLVLGRKHMNNWPRNIMEFIRNNVAIFLTNNLTHDDPFLLYATIKSGHSTDFFSRDLMRQHAHLLGPELKTIFRRWQQEHQYALVTQTETGKIVVKEPIRYLLYAHRNENYWHLPYKSEYSANPPDTFELPEKWLCIKIQTI